ncbi:hypothetical protein CE91St44_31880 [Oscillospiraceae bacterium]|nr:hypothetical protein CE91St44_31880 [Oscillospiraceae bacterium]
MEENLSFQVFCAPFYALGRTRATAGHKGCGGHTCKKRGKGLQWGRKVCTGFGKGPGRKKRGRAPAWVPGGAQEGERTKWKRQKARFLPAGSSAACWCRWSSSSFWR